MGAACVCPSASTLLPRSPPRHAHPGVRSALGLARQGTGLWLRRRPATNLPRSCPARQSCRAQQHCTIAHTSPLSYTGTITAAHTAPTLLVTRLCTKPAPDHSPLPFPNFRTPAGVLGWEDVRPGFRRQFSLPRPWCCSAERYSETFESAPHKDLVAIPTYQSRTSGRPQGSWDGMM